MKRALVFLAVIGCGGARSSPPSSPSNTTSEAVALKPVRLGADEVKRMAAEDFARWVSPTHGVLIVEFSSGGGADEAVENKQGTRICGSRVIVAELAAGLRERSADPYELTCAPDGDRTACRSNGLGEYDVDVDWIFAPGPDGPYLEALIAVERATMAQSWIDEADRFVKDALDRHRRGTCP